MRKLILIPAVALALGATAAPASAIVSPKDYKRCSTWSNPAGMNGGESGAGDWSVEDSTLFVDRASRQASCPTARRVARAYANHPRYAPRMLRVGGRWWHRTYKKVWYDDGEFGATQFTPSHVWDLTYQQGPKKVVLEYTEETWD